MVLAPISMTVQPYIAGLMIDAPRSKVAYEYHRWSQIQTFVTLCVLGTVLFFARPILQLWLGTDSSLVNSITPLVPFVALGSILNSLVAMPFICQMAAGGCALSGEEFSRIDTVFADAFYFRAPIRNASWSCALASSKS